MVEDGLFLLGPMNESELRDAIEEPARLVGCRLEPGLVHLLVRDVVNEPGALPLLSHALVETWMRREGAVLTVDGYRDAGGVRGAVARTAERLYEALPESQRVLARGLFLRLVETTETDVVDAYLEGRTYDVVLVPASITYDQLSEVAEFADEARGKAKQKEGMGWLVNVMRRSERRYGKIYVRFGEPVSLKDTLGAGGAIEDKSAALNKLAFEVATRINEVTPITATALLTMAPATSPRTHRSRG